MYIATLRKVEGSIMLVIPPALLDVLHLEVGATVGISINGEQLIVQPQTKPRYTLDELLIQCDPTVPMTEEDRAWLAMPAVGQEL